MFNLAATTVITRAIAFASTLAVSLAVVASRPGFKERRQRYFASAIKSESISRMQLLHLAGADVNGSAASAAPLLLAAADGRLKAVRYLLDEGADVNALASDGRTPLTEAVFYGHAPVVKELLVRGANTNAMTAQGTPLDIAINKNDPAMAELLRHYGAKRAGELRAH